MNGIKINALKVLVYTEQGLFGQYVNLKEGLNIVRARNTKGKSSILHLILYAFGVEELLGGKNANSMKPVLKDKLVYKGNLINVLESKVQLEIVNNVGEIITITRWIKSNSKDGRLVSIQNGPALTFDKILASKEYYVHLSGAAVEELGFHRFLSTFIGWDLPEVPTFDGKDRLLYMQTLFPLFYVEQITGWKSIYAPLKTNYKIRDVSKRAIEFLLNLDVLKNSKEKEELKLEKTLLTSSWTSVVKEAEQLALKVGGKLNELPAKPSLLLDIELLLENESSDFLRIEDRIFTLKKELYHLDARIRSIKDIETNSEKEVNELEISVLAQQDSISSLRRDIQLEMHNKSIMQNNLENLVQDLKKNQEANKIYKLGSELKFSLSENQCPTCGQHTKDTLLAQDINFQPMDLEENIIYIKEQITTLEFGIVQIDKVLDRRQVKLAILEQNLLEMRKQLRLIKEELSEDPRMPTQQGIEKIINLKWKIKNLEDTNQQFEQIKKKIITIQNDWKEYEAKLDLSSSEYFSELDKKKLKSLEKEIKKQLKKFGFSSIPINEIVISEDKYLPTAGGFDIKFDSSASDYIRIIWSYIISLCIISNEYEGNHPGLIILDEPGQQQMAIDSQSELFKSLSNVKAQSIIATSLKPSEIEEVTRDLPINIIDLGEEYIIKPYNEI